MDFRHQFSDFGLWTSDILQTSDCSLHCQTLYRCQTSKVSDNLFVTQQKQTYICNQISSRNTSSYMLWGSGELLIYGDRYHADHFRQTSDSFQTYGRLQTNFGQTLDVRILLQTLDLGQTSNIRLRILDF